MKQVRMFHAGGSGSSIPPALQGIAYGLSQVLTPASNDSLPDHLNGLLEKLSVGTRKDAARRGGA